MKKGIFGGNRLNISNIQRPDYLLLLLICLPLLGAASAESGNAEAPTGQRGYSLYFDQDLFVPGTNEDRDYTMGLGIEVVEDQGPLYLLGDVIDSIGPLLRLDKGAGRIYQSWFFGSVTYTPDDIGDPAPIYDDRPYASLLYLANKQVVADPHQVIGIEVMVGAIGLDVAEQVQSTVHQWVRDWSGDSEPEDPKGWRNQISDGGEPTLRWSFVEEVRVALSTTCLRVHVQTNAVALLNAETDPIEQLRSAKPNM